MLPALIIIDLQNWFFKIDRFSTVEGQRCVEELFSKVNELSAYFKENELPIFHVMTQHCDSSTRDLWSKRNNSAVLTEGTEDAAEVDAIAQHTDDIRIVKTRHSAFLRTKLEASLRARDVDTVVVCGYSTNACVGLTAIDAYEHDFDILLAGDAILGADENRTNSMLSVLRNEFGIVSLSNDNIFDKLSKCGA